MTSLFSASWGVLKLNKLQRSFITLTTFCLCLLVEERSLSFKERSSYCRCQLDYLISSRNACYDPQLLKLNKPQRSFITLTTCCLCLLVVYPPTFFFLLSLESRIPEYHPRCTRST